MIEGLQKTVDEIAKTILSLNIEQQNDVFIAVRTICIRERRAHIARERENNLAHQGQIEFAVKSLESVFIGVCDLKEDIGPINRVSY
jgi:hypothetical protein